MYFSRDQGLAWWMQSLNNLAIVSAIILMLGIISIILTRYMIKKVIFGIQIAIFAGVFSLTMVNWQCNQIGQNLINLSVCLTFVIGLQKIIIIWSDSCISYQMTVLLFFSLFLGRVFQQYNPSPTAYSGFNLFCGVQLLIILILNGGMILVLGAVLLFYCCRQMYRLMTESLLSGAQSIEEQEMTQLLNSDKLYREINDNTNSTCCICLSQFEPESECIELPGCLHCFHKDCISEWLQNKSTCPYCRSNIRLGMM